MNILIDKEDGVIAPGEIKIQDAFINLNISFRSQEPIYGLKGAGRMRIADFYLPSFDIYVEYEGAGVSIRNTERLEEYYENGIVYLRLFPNDIDSDNIEIIAQGIKNKLSELLTLLELSDDIINHCRIGNVELVRQDLSNGKDINFENERKTTPLMMACLCSNEKLFDFLLSANANPHLKGRSGWSSLHYLAFGCGSIAIAKKLVNLGVYIDSKGKTGSTPLMIAAGSNNLELVEFLINIGANVNAMNVNMSSALDNSRKRGNSEIEKYLLDHGARV